MACYSLLMKHHMIDTKLRRAPPPVVKYVCNCQAILSNIEGTLPFPSLPEYKNMFKMLMPYQSMRHCF